MFCVGFATLAVFATRAALFSGLDGSGAWPRASAPNARADLVDRNGQVLAVDLLRYGLYLDPSEVTDPAETVRALAAALPDLAAGAGGGGDHERAQGSLSRRRPHARDQGRGARPGLPGRHLRGGGRAAPIRWAPPAATSSASPTRAARAWPAPSGRLTSRSAPRPAASRRPSRSICGCRAPCEDELDSRRGPLRGQGRGWHRGQCPHRRNPGHGQLSGLRSQHPAASRPGTPWSTMPPRPSTSPARCSRFSPWPWGSTAAGRTSDTVFDVCSPLILPGQIIHDYDKGDCQPAACGRCSPTRPTSARPRWRCRSAATTRATISMPSACSRRRRANWSSPPGR